MALGFGALRFGVGGLNPKPSGLYGLLCVGGWSGLGLCLFAKWLIISSRMLFDSFPQGSKYSRVIYFPQTSTSTKIQGAQVLRNPQP